MFVLGLIGGMNSPLNDPGNFSFDLEQKLAAGMPVSILVTP
jgi:hypothetical protein